MRIGGAVFNLSLLSLFLGVNHPRAATFFVSTEGSDSFAGTATQPFRTITYAYSLAQPGDTILVLPGVYTDYSSTWGLHLGSSGTPSSPILLKSQTPGAAIIDGQNASDRNVGINIDGNFNIVDGFEVRNGPKGGITLWGNNNQILNCNIHNNGNPDDPSTDGRNGIYSDEGTSGNVYAANYVHHNGRSGSHLDHGLYLCGQNEMVVNNILLANSATGLQVAGYAVVSDLKVYNNVIAYNGSDGLTVWQALDGVDVKNNIFYQNGHYAIGAYAATGANVNFDHNLSFANGYGDFNLSDGGSIFSYNLGETIYSHPQFLNESPESFDAHVAVGSPAIQSALNLHSSFTTDMAGAPRTASGAWDLGVFVGDLRSARPTPSLPTVPVLSLNKASRGIILRWRSVPGAWYRIAYANTPAGPWDDLTGNINASDSSTSWLDTSATAASQRFYRVYVVH